MKSLLSCALGIVALAWGTASCWADQHAPCASGRCCGQASIHAASCCDDPCCKPSFWERWRGLFARKNDCCEPTCAQPADSCCDDCYKPSLWTWFMSRRGKQACDCCPDDGCQPRKRLFSGLFKKNDCCDPCNTSHTAAPAHAGPEMKAEPIPAPMPKDKEAAPEM